MKTLLAFLCGLLFGMGLLIAGMANPAKVIAFLNIGGLWDPSLALVMGAALALTSAGFWLLRRRGTTLFGDALGFPTPSLPDKALIIGSLTFGAGWGLAGICPGPAWVLLGTGSVSGVIFVLAMLAGTLICQWLTGRTEQ